MAFLHPEFAWTFLFSPLILFLYIAYQKKVETLFKEWKIKSRSFRKHRLIAISFVSFLFPLLLMKPVIKSNKPIYSHSLKGHTILFAIDVSNSMRENDFPPNRIDWSLQCVLNIIDSLAGNQLGLLLYSDYAYTIIPLTSDIMLFKNLLQQIHSSNIKGYSSNLRSCFAEAIKNFSNSQNKEGKVFVLFSDGEHYGDEFSSRLKNLENQNVHFIWISFPSPNHISPLDTINYKYKSTLKPTKEFQKLSQQLLHMLSIIHMPASLEKYAYELDLSPFLAILIFGILLYSFFLKTRSISSNEE